MVGGRHGHCWNSGIPSTGVSEARILRKCLDCHIPKADSEETRSKSRYKSRIQKNWEWNAYHVELPTSCAVHILILLDVWISAWTLLQLAPTVASDRKMRTTMLEDRIGSSYVVISAVSLDNNIKFFEYRLSILSAACPSRWNNGGIYDKKMRMTMLKDKMRSSYIISAVAPDKTVQCFDYRLFTVTISQCCVEPSAAEQLLTVILFPVQCLCWWQLERSGCLRLWWEWSDSSWGTTGVAHAEVHLHSIWIVIGSVVQLSDSSMIAISLRWKVLLSWITSLA